MAEMERRERELAIQNRFGPIVGISELSDRDFERLEKDALNYEAWKQRLYRDAPTKE